MGTARTLLGNRALVRSEAAWAVAALGTWMFAIVLALYAYYEHGPAGVGLAVAARMLPAAAFAWLPTVVASRWSHRTAVLASAAIRFLALEAVALVAWTEAPFALLLALAAVFEIAASVHRSARPWLVLGSARSPGDLAAFGSGRIVTSVGLLAGAVASALIVLAVSLQAAFAFAGLAFVAVAAIALRLPAGAGSSGARIERGERRRGRTAIRAIADQPWMRTRIGLLGAAVLVESMLDLLLVVVALDLVHAGDTGVGWLRAAFACGGLLTAAVAAGRLRSGRLAAGATAGLALAGIPLALVAAWPAVAPALVLIGLLGGGYGLLEVSIQLLSQRLLAPEAAADSAFLEGYTYPLIRAAGAGLGALVVLRVGESGAVVIGGLLLPAAAIFAIRPLRRAERRVAIPSQALELFGALPLFRALAPSAIENLAAAARSQTFDEGSTILHDHQRADRLYVIDDGLVSCTDEEGHVDRLERGSSFGQAAILPDNEQRSTITAVTPVTTWTIHRADFIRCLGAPARSAADPAGTPRSPLTTTAARVG